MTVGTLVLIAVSVYHIMEFKTVRSSGKAKAVRVQVVWSAANLIVVTAIGVGFGKPYSICYATLTAIFGLLDTYYCARSYYDWAERLCSIIGMFSLIGEYVYRAFTNRRIRTANEEEFF